MKLLRQYIRELLIEKKWADFNAPKGKTIRLSPDDFSDDCEGPQCPERDLDDEIFDLVQNAYKDVPLAGGGHGHIKVQDPSMLPGEYTWLSASDIDGDAEPDLFRGGKMKNGKLKLAIVGHDGSAAAIDTYKAETAALLQSGAMAEMSGAIAHIMITRHGVPAVTTQEEVEALLGKKVDWVGVHPNPKSAQRYGSEYEGWYCRGIGACGEVHMKILLGGG